MKININDDKIVVFLNNKKYINYNKEQLEVFLKDLLSKLEFDYNFDIRSLTDICIYQDYHYGIILELKYDDLDCFFDYTDIEINIFKNKYFLYEIDYNYINKSILNSCTIYQIKDKIYLKIKKDLKDKNYYKILEYSDIIYGEKAIKIENIGKKVNYEKTSSSVSGKT